MTADWMKGVYRESRFVDTKGRQIIELTPIHELGGNPDYMAIFAYEESGVLKRAQCKIDAKSLSEAFEKFEESAKAWVLGKSSRIVLPGRNGFNG